MSTTTPLQYEVVILAEDDPVLRRTLSDFLSDEGFLVREAEDLATLRRAIDDSATAALVLDVQLADGDVSDVVADLGRRAERPPIVLISASRHAAGVAREHRIPLLRKPIDLDDLVAALLLPTDERPTDC